MPFPYFGRKGRLAKEYPAPIYDTIVEPFAGSAGYALHYFDRQVLLVELDPAIVALWDYLIDPKVTAATIANLPDMRKGQNLRDLFGDGPELTLAQLVSPSENYAKSQVTAWMERDWPRIRRRVATMIDRVKHWEVKQGDYSTAPNIEATWFIDPPYQKVSFGYEDSRQSLNFKSLGQWCMDRPGQVIVCEARGANWLPFQDLREIKTLDNTRRTEVVYVSVGGQVVTWPPTAT